MRAEAPLLLLLAVATTGCPPAADPLPPATPCSEYFPVAWSGEWLSLTGTDADLGPVDVVFTYEGLIGEGLYNLREDGTPAHSPEWTADRRFRCEDGETQAVKVLDDCSFRSPLPFAWDGMSAGFEEPVSTECEEFGWPVTGTVLVPACEPRQLQIGLFDACSIRWELQVDYSPDNGVDDPVPEVLEAWLSPQLGPVEWQSLQLTSASILDE
jgi:hypothetical protein